jgi:hypothetical protein
MGKDKTNFSKKILVVKNAKNKKCTLHTKQLKSITVQ